MQDSTFPHELHVHLQCIRAEVLFIFVRSSQFNLLNELFVLHVYFKSINLYGGLRVRLVWGWMGVLNMGFMNTSDNVSLAPMFPQTFVS